MCQCAPQMSKDQPWLWVQRRWRSLNQGVQAAVAASSHLPLETVTAENYSSASSPLEWHDLLAANNLHHILKGISTDSGSGPNALTTMKFLSVIQLKHCLQFPDFRFKIPLVLF